jgi:hypothetical protein
MNILKRRLVAFGALTSFFAIALNLIESNYLEAKETGSRSTAAAKRRGQTLSPEKLKQLILASFPKKYPMSAPFTEGIKSVNFYTGGYREMHFSISDSAYSRKKNQIFDDVSLNQLPSDHTYTFVMTAEGEVSYGMITNNWEFGVKHLNIAGARKILVAGEVCFDHADHLTYNLLSGTFTRLILERNTLGMTEDDLKTAVEKVFSAQIGAGRFEYAAETHFPISPPDRKEHEELCQSPIFSAENPSFCRFTRDEVHTLLHGKIPGYSDINSVDAQKLLAHSAAGTYLVQPMPAYIGSEEACRVAITYKDLKSGRTQSEVIESFAPYDLNHIKAKIEELRRAGRIAHAYSHLI